MKLGNNQFGAGGSQVDASAPLGSDKWKDPAHWEQNHEKQWGGFENYQEKLQNWAQDSNSGNYKLANQQFGAFDNGQFNQVKGSEEFFGPDHVNNDLLRGNFTTNAGFGVGAKINLGAGGAGGSGKGDKGVDGKGGFWGKLHCRIHSSIFLNKKHLRLPVPCFLLL
jgi:hypothetical protein